MIVSKDTFDETLKKLFDYKVLSFDTETTGLSPYKGDRLFSIIIGTSEREAYYFNFNVMPDIPKEYILSPSHLRKLGALFAKEDILWFGHNAKFDMHFLAKEGIEIAGKIHCTMVTARLVYNVHMSYSLSECASRIGYSKDDAVAEYIKKNHLWAWEEIPGVKKREKRMFFNKVPFDVIAPYGETDAKVTYALGVWQLKELERLSGPSGVREEGCTVPPVSEVYENDCKLVKAIYQLEKRGIPIDRKFCEEATAHNEAIAEKLKASLDALVGGKYIDGERCNMVLFAEQKNQWQKSEKGKFSFKKDVLKYFDCPNAKLLRQYREAKYAGIFFRQVLWFSGSDNILRPNLNPAGTDTSRLSSNNPNSQNMRNDEEMDTKDPAYPWRARKSFVVPNDEYEIVVLDYKSQEYRLAFIYGRQLDMIERIKEGWDVHLATAYLMGLTTDKETKDHQKKARKLAKHLNFAILYGAGDAKLAKMLGVSLEEAQRLRAVYFARINGVASFSSICKTKAEKRGFILTWAGRVLYYPYRFSSRNKEMSSTAYKAVNGLIQSGCAEINRIAMVRVTELLKGAKSYLALSIHDELDLFIHKDEKHFIPQVKEIMESVHNNPLLKMQVSVAIGKNNFGDLEEVE